MRSCSRNPRRGITTSLDINFDPQWRSAAPAVVRRRKQLLRNVLPLVDLAHGNVAELCEFTDGGDLDSALRRLTTWGVNAVVVHLGARGRILSGRRVDSRATRSGGVARAFDRYRRCAQYVHDLASRSYGDVD